MVTEQIIYGGFGSTAAITGTKISVCPIGLMKSTTTVPLEVVIPWCAAGKIRDLNVSLTVAPGAGTGINFKVSKATSPSAGESITANISGTDTTGNSGDDSMTVAQGDLIRIILQASAGVPATTQWHFSYRWIPDTDKEFILGGNGNQATVSNSANNFLALSGHSTTFSTTELNKEIIIPTAGTITRITVRTQEDPGSGKSYEFTARINKVDTALDVTINGDGNGLPLIASSTASVSVSAGNTIAIKCDPTNTPTATQVSYSMTFLPDDDNVFIVPSSSDENMAQRGTRYRTILSGDAEWSATEGNHDSLANHGDSSAKFKLMRVKLTGSPGFGNKWDFTLRKNGSDTGITGTISASGTSVIAFGNIPISDGDLFNVKVIPNSDPTVSHSLISFVVETIPVTVHIKGGDILGGDIL